MNYEKFTAALNSMTTNDLASREEIEETVSMQNSIRGTNEITVMTMEELSELSQRLAKTLRKDTRKDFEYNRNTILEEAADVYISLIAILKVQGIDDETFDKAVTVKIRRIQEKCEELRQLMMKQFSSTPTKFGEIN